MFQRLLAKPLSAETVDDLVKAELQVILDSCDPSAIYLFGSAARCDMTDASDLDFLVVVQNNQNLKELKKKYYCRTKTSYWPVDIVFLHQVDFEKNSLIGGVAMICKQEGKLLYEGNR